MLIKMKTRIYATPAVKGLKDNLQEIEMYQIGMLQISNSNKDIIAIIMIIINRIFTPRSLILGADIIMAVLMLPDMPRPPPLLIIIYFEHVY